MSELSAKGISGQIAFDGQYVTIARKGIVAMAQHGAKGDKKIPIAQVSAVQFREATSMLNGYIRFTFPGAIETQGGYRDATTDENAVIFRKKSNADFVAIHNAIEAAIHENS